MSYPAAEAVDERGTPSISYSFASGTLFVPGVTVVRATALDGAGNSAECTFEISVTAPGDGSGGGGGGEDGAPSGCGCGAPGGGIALAALLLLEALGGRVRRSR